MGDVTPLDARWLKWVRVPLVECREVLAYLDAFIATATEGETDG